MVWSTFWTGSLLSERAMPEQAAKKGWTRVAFGDVVRQVRDRVDPHESGLARYVAGEHMETDDLRIRRWGVIGDGYLGPAFHMRFRPGQVLYGSRRTYLRKVAVADFEGITANTTFVLEPKNSNVLLPGLLPFFMQTESFHEHSIKQSKGSVNPYVNFSDLAWYEFELPPLEEQARILQALIAARELAEAYDRQLESLWNVRQALEMNTLVGGARSWQSVTSIENVELPAGWKLVAASTLCSAPITGGITPRDGEKGAVRECPFIKVGNLTFDGHLDFGASGSRINAHAFRETESLHVVPGDILTNIVGPPLGKVSVVPASIPRALINQAIVRFRPNSPEIGSWLLAYLMSPWAKHWLFLRSKKTSGQRNINATTCAALPVPMPPSQQLATLLTTLDRTRDATRVTGARNRQARQLLSLLLAEGLS